MEDSMKLTDFFLAQLDREVASSRLALQRVPEGHNQWKPHDKQDELDLKSPGAAKFKPLEWSSRQELVSALDEAHAEAREALQKTDDEHLLTTWRFVIGEHVVSENPRHVMIADAVFSHLAHHRGQLTVYLRLNEASVPALYGPSADEGKAA
jgi:uncharacterized damage-inducible protein DinB